MTKTRFKLDVPLHIIIEFKRCAEFSSIPLKVWFVGGFFSDEEIDCTTPNLVFVLSNMNVFKSV